jgi:hypothetical protein
MKAGAVRTYIKYRSEVARLERRLSTAKENMEKSELRIAEMMEREGVQSFKAGDVLVTYDGVKTHYRINKSEEERSFGWLRENGGDGLIRIKPQVHWGSFQNFCDELMERGGKIPEFVVQYTKPKLNFTGIASAVNTNIAKEVA